MRLKDYRKKAKELGGKLKVRSNSQKWGQEDAVPLGRHRNAP